MSLFDTLVDEALRAKSDHNLLRPVVEKELFHISLKRSLFVVPLSKVTV